MPFESMVKVKFKNKVMIKVRVTYLRSMLHILGFEINKIPRGQI
jgi:hypothetical protein